MHERCLTNTEKEARQANASHICQCDCNTHRISLLDHLLFDQIEFQFPHLLHMPSVYLSNCLGNKMQLSYQRGLVEMEHSMLEL